MADNTMNQKQKVTAKVDGIDVNLALKSALRSAKPPRPGFDIQTLKLESLEITYGGFVGDYTTLVSGIVIDGSFKDLTSPDPIPIPTDPTKPQPRFESLEESPVIRGGLTEKHIKELEAKGWELRTLKGDRPDIPVAFSSKDTPSGFVVKYGTVPDGTVVMENEKIKQSIIVKCGNQCPILNRDYVVGRKKK